MKTSITILLGLILASCNEIQQNPTSKNEESKQKELNIISIDTTYQELLIQKIERIKENYKRINRIDEWTATDKRKLDESTEGGAATYYYLRDTLLKIEVTHFGETGKSIQNFYTKNKELSFVFEQTYTYNRPITWDSIAMIKNNDNQIYDFNKSEVAEDKSFFEKGILIRQINNESYKSSFAQDNLKREEIRLNTVFEKLIDKIKK